MAGEWQIIKDLYKGFGSSMFSTGVAPAGLFAVENKKKKK